MSPLRATANSIPFFLQRTCACGGGCPNCANENDVSGRSLAIQKKSLEISSPTDPDEKEANEVARKVVAGQPAEIHGTGAAVSRKGTGPAASLPGFESKLHGSKGGGQALDLSIRGEMESKMGADFSAVRIHTGSEAHILNESVKARAFTHGADIYFRYGEFDTASTPGKELLAHELTHTVQQGKGVQMKGAEMVQRLEADDLDDEASVEMEEFGFDEEEEMQQEGKSVDACGTLTVQSEESESALAEVNVLGNGGPGKKKPKKKQNSYSKFVADCFKSFGKYRGERVPRGKFVSPFKKKHKGKKKEKRRCCTEYDLTGERVAAGHQPVVANKETDLNLPAIRKECSYEVNWDMHEVADQMIISDYKTGQIYLDKTKDGTDNWTVNGPANVNIHVNPNPLIRPTRYDFEITKFCGRVKATRTCYLWKSIPLPSTSWIEILDPTKTYERKCNDDPKE